MQLVPAQSETTYTPPALPQQPAASPQSYQVLDRARLRQGFQPTSPDAGFLQAGEIVQAVEWALNDSGVMRIRTARGWVSTQGSDGTILLEPMTGTESSSVQQRPPQAVPTVLTVTPLGAPPESEPACSHCIFRRKVSQATGSWEAFAALKDAAIARFDPGGGQLFDRATVDAIIAELFGMQEAQESDRRAARAE